MLPLDVWDILVAEQPSSEEWHTAIQSGSCPDLKDEDYDHGTFCAIGYLFIYLLDANMAEILIYRWCVPLDIVYMIVYLLKLVYKFKLVYSFKVVYRCNEA